MDLIAFLAVGFFVGMGHALEADHLAAVATMLCSGANRRALILRGAVWGLGHTLALFVICSAVVLLGLTISGTLEAVLEFCVGVMIVVLGLQVIWRLRRERIHIHAHEHDGVRHIHAHSHAGEPASHRESAHLHRHPAPLHHALFAHRKALLVGLMHGAAGSAALLVLMVATTNSPGEALAYFLVFGIGSILGMATLSAVASYPLLTIQRGALWLRNLTTAAIGLGALWVGGHLAYESLIVLQQAGL